MFKTISAVSAGLALLFSVSCSSVAVAPATPKQRLFLSFYVSASPYDIGPHLRVYDGGMLILSHERRELVATADAETLAQLREIARDPQWRRLLANLAASHNIENHREGEFSISIRSESGGTRLFTLFPFEDMPEEMRPYLKKVDDVFLRTFGSKYPFLLSSVRTIP